MTWLYIFGSTLLVSLISLIGVLTLSWQIEKLKKRLLFLVSFSTGGLLGNAFFHLLPEVVEESGFGLKTSLMILAGIIAFFILEKFIRWRHCHIPTSSEHPHPLTYTNLIGDGLHNFLDGLIIVGAYLVNLPLGFATTLAIILHEIPQEIGDFGVLLYGGYNKKKALFFNFLSALTAFLGVFVALFFSQIFNQQQIASWLIPFAAGGFIYIAGADLIPELHKETSTSRSSLQLIFFISGLALMLILKLLD